MNEKVIYFQQKNIYRHTYIANTRLNWPIEKLREYKTRHHQNFTNVNKMDGIFLCFFLPSSVFNSKQVAITF